MNNTNMIGWTSWCSDLKDNNFLDGNGKKTETKSIYFQIAVKRRYKKKQLNEDGTPKLDGSGKPIRDFPTDFYLVKAFGKAALLVDRFFNNYKKVDGGKDKIISRKIYIEGTLENYEAKKYQKIFLKNNDNNEIVLGSEKEHEQKFNIKLNYDQTLINLDFFRILDGKFVDSKDKYPDVTDSSSKKKKTKEKVENEYTDLDELSEEMDDELGEFEKELGDIEIDDIEFD